MKKKPVRKATGKKLRVTYAPVEGVPEAEMQRRLDAAFDVLFDAMAKKGRMQR